MGFEVPDGAMIFKHIAGQSGAKDICADLPDGSPGRLKQESVADRRQHYREKYCNSQNKDATVTVYFEPTMGEHGAFFFVVVRTTIVQYGNY